MSLELQLTALLNREVDCVQQLLDILKREHDALVHADIEAIEQVTADKNQALNTQANITQARYDLTLRHSFSATHEGFQQLIATCENQWSLSETYSRLTSLAEECHTANRTNGRLITQKQQQARGALDIIRQTDSKTPTYSDHGTTTTPQNSRSLGRA